MMFNKKLTTEEFINKCMIIHDNKYDYSLVNYINNKTKVKIICKEHGIFEQKANNHLNLKQGCPNCKGGIKLSQNIFIKKAKLKHGNKYNYSKVKYINSDEKIIIICKEHGEFLQSPKKHLFNKNCPICSEEIRRQKRLKNDLISVQKIFKNNNCELLENKYINCDFPMKYICSCGNKSKITLYSFQQGQRCRSCAIKRMSGENHHNWNPDRELLFNRRLIKTKIRSILNRTLKIKHNLNKRDIEKIIGYKWEELIKHLQKQSLYELWLQDSKNYHIHHIIPINKFLINNIIDPKIINALDNLTILTKKENLHLKDKCSNEDFINYLNFKNINIPENII